MKRSNTTGFAPSRTSAGHRTAMGRLLLMTLLLFAFLGGAKAQNYSPHWTCEEYNFDESVGFVAFVQMNLRQL